LSAKNCHIFTARCYTQSIFQHANKYANKAKARHNFFILIEKNSQINHWHFISRQ